ncbi:winged helix-turn-helix transcriptional regulator [Flavobacterium subsaxonicum]|uniref:winged helix-turn-helix transcriptional regulator n=1 Tax=Flavobacterium subsaxonicum TaxID=426226 RepID=UPI000411DC61|nr:helix-turn-helix domain-containing protein [Flavobacterium subsaxonicum]
METQDCLPGIVNCPKEAIMPVKDALEALSGKWKIPILVSLSRGTKRFKEISKEVGGITDKMLSKELKDLEMNLLVSRKVLDTFPPTVEYSWTDHSRTLGKLIHELQSWGKLHRKKIIEG